MSILYQQIYGCEANFHLVLLHLKSLYFQVSDALQHYQYFTTSISKFSMKAVVNSSEEYLRKYRTLKQSLQLPLKISLYFNFLEAALDDQTVTKKRENFHGFSPLFYPTFCNLSRQQKSFYLLSNMQFIKAQYDKIEINSNNRQNSIEGGNNIKATGQISDTVMSLSYWMKVEMSFNFQNRKIKLVTKSRNMQIDVRLYLIRKSKKYENTFVLEAISDVVSVSDRKISLFFKATVFEDIYNEIFKCIINFRNQQLYKVALEDYATYQQSMAQVSYIGKNSRSLNFLTAKNVNQFLNFKDHVLNKMIRAEFKFEKIYAVQDCKIEKDKSYGSSEYSLYKLQTNFNCNVEVLKKNFLTKYSNQSFRYLMQSQQLEKSSNKYAAIYQKFLFDSSLQSFKTIEHILIQQLNLKQTTTQNEQLVFQKGVKGIKLNHFFEFLMIKVKGLGTQNKSKLIIVGSFSKQFQNGFSLKKQKNRIQNLQVQQNQQIIIKYLLQFSQMVFRKENEEENMERILSNLRSTKSLDEVRDISIDNQQDQQFYTVSGNFKNQREEIVLDIDSCCQNQEKEDNNVAADNLTEYSSNIVSNIPSYRYQLQPHPEQINLERQKKTSEYHFIFQEWYRKPKGGVICKDQSAIGEQKKVANFILKTLGKRIFQQKGLLNLSLPVTIFRPESHLHSVARNLSFAPIFLEKAVTIDDPVERIKYIMLYTLSVTVSSISVNKPFNPIIGQTLQVWIDGCPVYLEQISHHPPISAYYMIGRGYKAYGSIGPKVSFGFNSITGYTEESNFVEFDDGTVVQINFGKMIINGIIIGQRTFNFTDKMYAIDHKNKIFSQLKFGQQKSSIFSSSQQPSDYLFGRICRMKDQFIQQFYKNPHVTYPTKQTIVQQLSKFEGTWNGKITFDNQLYVDFSTANGCAVEPQKLPLPSDSSFRKDIRFLRQGKTNNSQHEKDLLENIQRRDNQLRKTFEQS